MGRVKLSGREKAAPWYRDCSGESPLDNVHFRPDGTKCYCLSGLSSQGSTALKPLLHAISHLLFGFNKAVDHLSVRVFGNK